MADINSGLPIRSELSGVDEVVVSRLCDESDKTKQAAVDSDKNLHVEVHGNDPTGADKVIRTSELGALTPDGDYHATNNTVPGSIGIIVHDRAGTPADIHQNFRPTGIQGTDDADVHAIDVALFDEAGNPFSLTNPLPVYLAQEGAGTEINDYNTATAVAAAASDNHEYTVPAGNDFIAKRVWATASGKMKIEVQIDIGAGYVTKYVGFNSTANPNIDLTLAPIQLAAAEKIKVIRTNLDKQAENVYSTIEGVILA